MRTADVALPVTFSAAVAGEGCPACDDAGGLAGVASGAFALPGLPEEVAGCGGAEQAVNAKIRANSMAHIARALPPFEHNISFIDYRHRWSVKSKNGRNKDGGCEGANLRTFV